MKRETITATNKLLLGVTAGFCLSWVISHPKSKMKHKLPVKRYKRISFLPNIRYYHDEYIVHLHHWLILSICYIPFLISKKNHSRKILHGIFLGSILQGLIYKDRLQFRYPHSIE